MRINLIEYIFCSRVKDKIQKKIRPNQIKQYVRNNRHKMQYLQELEYIPKNKPSKATPLHNSYTTKKNISYIMLSIQYILLNDTKYPSIAGYRH